MLLPGSDKAEVEVALVVHDCAAARAATGDGDGVGGSITHVNFFKGVLRAPQDDAVRVDVEEQGFVGRALEETLLGGEIGENIFGRQPEKLSYRHVWEELPVCWLKRVAVCSSRGGGLEREERGAESLGMWMRILPCTQPYFMHCTPGYTMRAGSLTTRVKRMS